MTPPTPNQNPQKPFKWCRVWDAVDKVMISPDYVTRDGVAHWTCHSIPETSRDLMWSTGLLDKNGVEIFEGDRVRHPSGNKYVVAWDVFGWALFDYIDGLGCNELWLLDNEELKVIGNIHEHPHLLQKGPEDE